MQRATGKVRSPKLSPLSWAGGVELNAVPLEDKDPVVEDRGRVQLLERAAESNIIARWSLFSLGVTSRAGAECQGDRTGHGLRMTDNDCEQTARNARRFGACGDDVMTYQTLECGLLERVFCVLEYVEIVSKA